MLMSIGGWWSSEGEKEKGWKKEQSVLTHSFPSFCSHFPVVIPPDFSFFLLLHLLHISILCWELSISLSVFDYSLLCFLSFTGNHWRWIQRDADGDEKRGQHLHMNHSSPQAASYLQHSSQHSIEYCTAAALVHLVSVICPASPVLSPFLWSGHFWGREVH